MQNRRADTHRFACSSLDHSLLPRLFLFVIICFVTASDFQFHFFAQSFAVRVVAHSGAFHHWPSVLMMYSITSAHSFLVECTSEGSGVSCGVGGA